MMIRHCPSCGASNRVPAQHLADTGRCGACNGDLPPLAEPVEVDPPTFDETVRQAKVPVLVDFWAEWCGPCRIAAPEVARLAQEMAGKAIILKVDTEAHPELGDRFGISAIPNFVVLKNGQVVLQRAGFAGRTQLKAWLVEATAAA